MDCRRLQLTLCILMEAERLLELCEKDFPTATTLSVTKDFRALKRLLEDR